MPHEFIDQILENDNVVFFKKKNQDSYIGFPKDLLYTILSDGGGKDKAIQNTLNSIGAALDRFETETKATIGKHGEFTDITDQYISPETLH